jgi:hypothetical protein
MDDNNNTTPAALDAEDIAKNPEAYGFTWVYRPLNKGTDQKTRLRDDVPHIEVSAEQVPLFAKHFPLTGVMMSIRGTSAVVRGQNVSRTYIGNNPKATNHAIAVNIVRSVLLGQITKSGGGKRIVYVVDGVEYPTLEAAKAAKPRAAVAEQSDTEKAAAFMAEAQDLFGVSYADARAAAIKKFPAAFAITTDDDESDEPTA